MIKKGIKVKILAGKDKKKEGEVIEIDRSNNRAKVKGINLVKKHVKTTKEKKGGIIDKENFINLSNLSVIDKAGELKKSVKCQVCPNGWEQKLSGQSFCKDLGYLKPSSCDENQYLNLNIFLSDSEFPPCGSCRRG